MSDAVTFAIAQALQGLAGAGSEVADASYKNKVSEYQNRQQQAKLARINNRVQEILDQNKAETAGTSLEEMTGSLDPVSRAVYSTLSPTSAPQQSLADKIRGATSPAPASVGQEATPSGDGAAPPAPAPQQPQDEPLWQRRLQEIMSRGRKPQSKTVQGALERTAALLQASQEMGVDPEDLKKIADSGGFLRDLTKDVVESDDRQTAEQNKTGMEYLQQTSQDKRLEEEIESREEIAALERALREKIARMAEAGKNNRASQVTEAWKARVATIKAITEATYKDKGQMMTAIQTAAKLKDPSAQAAVLEAAGVPFTADSTGGKWFLPWSKKTLEKVTPLTGGGQPEINLNKYIRQLTIEDLRDLQGISEDDEGDMNEDPISPPVVLKSKNGGQGSTLPGENPRPKPFRR